MTILTTRKWGIKREKTYNCLTITLFALRPLSMKGEQSSEIISFWGTRVKKKIRNLWTMYVVIPKLIYSSIKLFKI